MNIKDIRNGQLYSDTRNKRVVRVHSKANSTSVLATHHSSTPEFVKAEDLKRASKKQCEKYLS